MAKAPPNHRPCTHRLIYRLTCDDYNQLIARAEGRCDRCGEESRRLCVDHDYGIGSHAVRGFVCNRCNTIICKVETFDRRVGPDDATLAYLANPFHSLISFDIMDTREAKLLFRMRPAPRLDWAYYNRSQPRMIDITDAPETLGISFDAVEDLRLRGRLPTVKVGGKTVVRHTALRQLKMLMPYQPIRAGG